MTTKATDLTQLRDAVRGLAVAAHPKIYEPSEFAPRSTEGTPGFVVPTDVPAREKFDAVAQLTPPLAQIYESGEEGIFVATSIGTGWRITPDALASSLIASAGRSIIFAGGDTDAATLADEGVKMLDDLVALLAGEAISVTVVGALSGIALPPGTELQLPWGRARNAPQELAGMGIFSNRRPHLVLIGSVEVTLYVQDDSEEPPNIFDPGPLRRFNRAAVLLPLAALLGIEGENYLAPQWLWQTTLLPAGLGNAFSGTALGSRPLDQFLVAANLTKDEATSLEEWASLVDGADDSTIEVAIRRVLSAVRERVAYEDALIDAVVAMESLSVTGEPPKSRSESQARSPFFWNPTRANELGSAAHWARSTPRGAK